MKTVGLIGGMSWESTSSYYQLINQGVKDALGGLHSAKLVLISLDFAEIEALQSSGNWGQAAKMLIDAALRLEAAGADAIMVCTNTMHKVAEDLEASIDLPLLHIADATATVLVENGIETVALLGTAFTMEEDFYIGRLARRGLNVITPIENERELVHKVIYQELCVGEIREESRLAYLSIIKGLAEKGAQAIILGCTEIGLLVSQDHTDIELYDTTAIHARAAVEFILS